MSKRLLSETRIADGSRVRSEPKTWPTKRVYMLYPFEFERCESKRFDVISRLIDRNMGDVVENIFSNLSEADVANAVTASPKWAAIVTSRRCAEKFFSRDVNCASLRALYRRIEPLHENNASKTFAGACHDFSKLDEFRVRWNRSWDVSEQARRSNRSSQLRNIFVGKRYIALVRQDYSECSILEVYDCCTLKRVNTTTVRSNPRIIEFIGESLVIHCNSEDVDVWNVVTGKVHALKRHSQSEISRMFCVSNLIVLLKRNESHSFACVYKCGNRRAPKLIVDKEPLSRRFERFSRSCEPQEVLSDDNLDYFGIVRDREFFLIKCWVFQLRSKRDFSLQRVIFIMSASLLRDRATLLLSDRFVFADDSNGEWLNVISLTEWKQQIVYAFLKPENMHGRGAHSRERSVSLIGNSLLVLSDGRWRFDTRRCAAIWELPRDFVETCSHHLRLGTVGRTFECDQLIRGDITRSIRIARVLA